MTNEELQAHVISGELHTFNDYSMRENAPRIECADGFNVSVQASNTHCCSPRDNEGPYTTFECGFPSHREEILMPYAEEPDTPTGTVYGYVPAEVILQVIEVHGGAV